MKKILLTFSILAITSCSTVNGYLVSEKKEGWFNGIRVSDIGPSSPFSFLNPFVQRGFMYCKANDKNDSGLADPVCYRVRYSTYLNEKSNYPEKNNYVESNSKSSPSSESVVQNTFEKNDDSSNSQKNNDNKKNKIKR
jgi:hypothetical protein